MDVRKHTIKEVVHNVLEADVWWGDQPEKPEKEGLFNWFWWGWKSHIDDGEKEKKKHRKGEGNVPTPIIETDCVVCDT